MKVKFNKILILSAVCHMLYAISGCGYTSRSMISDKYKTIYVAPFANRIDITSSSDAASKYKLYRPALETEVTRAVTNKFLFDGNLKPGQKDKTDLTLSAELVEFRKDPLRYTEANEVEEYRISISINVRLRDNAADKSVWEENGFTGQSTFFTSGPTAKSEATAIDEALSDLARRIVERTVEQW